MDVFSSAKDRPRDKVLQEKHQKELAEKDKKIERLQRANNEALKQHFEAQTRGNRLAQALGFQDIFEAQIAIDIAGHEIPYKECFGRVETLQERVSTLRSENESLVERIAFEVEKARNDAEEEVNKRLVDAQAKHEAELKRMVASEAKSQITISRQEQELEQLRERYDSLLSVKERAAERYKLDYARWRNFRDWLFKKETTDGDDERLTEEEKKMRTTASVIQKKKLLMEIEEGGEPSSTPYPKPPPLGGITNVVTDKENQEITPVPSKPSSYSAPHPRIPSIRNKLLDAISHPKPASSSPTLFNEGLDFSPSMPPGLPSRDEPPSPSPRSSPTVVGTASKPPRNKLLDTVTRLSAPMASLVVGTPSSLRKPLHFEPVISSPPVKEATKLSAFIEQAPASSQTEEDSQAGDEFIAPVNRPLIPTSPAPVLSSETEADSQSQMFPFPFLDPTPCPARPAKPLVVPPTTRAHPSLPDKPSSTLDRRVVSSRDPESAQPVKRRRVSDSDDEDSFGNGDHKSKRGKEREREVVASSSTPANPQPSVGQRRTEDYSAYKGRGRYGKHSTAQSTTINAQFEINPARNGGLDYQYDEVVRGKEDRRRMNAGDCEECREYYEAVGPLPKRLQAPLWRSPSSTPSKTCSRHSHSHGSASASRGASPSDNASHKKRKAEIASHKQAISRHRHQWERPKTPPGYWNIGFPDTQEAEAINKEAKEMHRRKRNEIEAAARKDDGRYRRRS
ncbi:hypothetical protein H0H92_009751 [Tricholoma furcatifolium]|nr:hypothetical protein H0H92_009751 [Tricholoma furcatifolium]